MFGEKWCLPVYHYTDFTFFYFFLNRYINILKRSLFLICSESISAQRTTVAAKNVEESKTYSNIYPSALHS